MRLNHLAILVLLCGITNYALAKTMTIRVTPEVNAAEVCDAVPSEPKCGNEGLGQLQLALPEKEVTAQLALAVAEDAISQVEPEPTILSFQMKSGLIKTQVNEIIELHFPEYTPYWGKGEFTDEWFGNYVIESKDRWELLNESISAYSIALNVKKNLVLKFTRKTN